MIYTHLPVRFFTLRVGIEPTASWLTAKRSAPELTKPGADQRITFVPRSAQITNREKRTDLNEPLSSNPIVDVTCSENPRK